MYYLQPFSILFYNNFLASKQENEVSSGYLTERYADKFLPGKLSKFILRDVNTELRNERNFNFSLHKKHNGVCEKLRSIDFSLKRVSYLDRPINSQLNNFKVYRLECS